MFPHEERHHRVVLRGLAQDAHAGNAAQALQGVMRQVALMRLNLVHPKRET